LTGALGIFGFVEASQVAKEVEEIFRAGGALNQKKALHLAGLLATLRDVMGKPKAQTGNGQEIISNGHQAGSGYAMDFRTVSGIAESRMN
jgi:hypothetical protein